MKKIVPTILLIGAGFLATSCATIPADRYNTQKGAAIGAGIGALAGQAIGRNTGGTLLGAGIGTLAGSIIGNARDQEYAAAREAAHAERQVAQVDERILAPESASAMATRQNTDCRKVTKRVWNKGTMVSESVEEICEGEQHSRNY